MTNKYPQMASKAWKLEEREGRGCCLVANKSLLPGLEKISCRQQCQQLFANSKVVFLLNRAIIGPQKSNLYPIAMQSFDIFPKQCN